MKNDIEVLEIEGFSEPDTSLLQLDDELKLKRIKKIIFMSIFNFLVVLLLIMIVLYGPYKGVKNWLIETSLNNNSTLLINFLYSDDSINEVISKNYIKEPLESSISDNIVFTNVNKTDERYKIIEIKEKKFYGHVVEIYDLNNIKFETDIAKILTSKIAINVSGKNGLQGIVIKDGKLIGDNIKNTNGGGVIGFDENNKLILGKYKAKEVINLGVQSAIEYGPFLMINGKKTFISGNVGMNKINRSGIAQRKDGVVLFVQVKNITLKDFLNIFEKYKAYNAVCLPEDEYSILIKNGNIEKDKKNKIVGAFVLQ